MADINVEHRKPSVWPWVVGLLVLALLVWALVEMFGEGAEGVTTETTNGADSGVAPLEPAPFPAISDSLGLPVDTAVLTIPQGDSTADTATAR